MAGKMEEGQRPLPLSPGAGGEKRYRPPEPMIGMLGGMGPEATSYTYMRMVRYCQERYGAMLDSDFPPILVYSLPVPDVVDGIADDAPVRKALVRGIDTLKGAGASFAFIACNSMQGFVPDLRERMQMISLVEETIREARASEVKRWGMLATGTTIAGGLYQRALRESALESLVPSDAAQYQVTAAIRDILAGGRIAEARKRPDGAVSSLRAEGAEGLVLACTDLPIAFSEGRMGIPILDTADISARAAIERFRLGREGASPSF